MRAELTGLTSSGAPTSGESSPSSLCVSLLLLLFWPRRRACVAGEKQGLSKATLIMVRIWLRR